MFLRFSLVQRREYNRAINKENEKKSLPCLCVDSYLYLSVIYPQDDVCTISHLKTATLKEKHTCETNKLELLKPKKKELKLKPC